MRIWFKSFKESRFFYPALLLFAAGLIYLFLVNRIGFFYDDWYLIFDGHAQGPAYYHEVFLADRPARAYLQAAAYLLFKDQVVYYKLLSFAFRYFSSLALFLTLNLVWSKNKHANFLAAFFFLVYPGFLKQVSSIDYMAHMASLCFAILSIVFSIKATLAISRLSRVGYLLAAILLGWIYLGLMEYYIGLEFLRLLMIWVVTRNGMVNPARKTLINAVLKWSPYSLIPIGFLVWRLFFFTSTREATNVDAQVGVLLTSPFYISLWWFKNLMLSFFSTVFFAWLVPFYLYFTLRLKDAITVIGMSTGLVILVLFLLNSKWNGKDRSGSPPKPIDSEWTRIFLLGGILAVLVGLIPVIISNRAVNLDEYSRYTLPSLPGAVMILTALLYQINSKQARLIVVGIIFFFASATHLANAINYADQSEALRKFWWQVSWRAPQFQPGTTLTSIYPSTPTSQDYLIWGPANLIYYPQRQDGSPVHVQLPALILNNSTLPGFLAQTGDSEYTKRGNLVHTDNRSLLVMAQASDSTCVRLLDGKAPELSAEDNPLIMLVAINSKLERVLVDGPSTTPPQSIFGAEPKHTWCYYYEKADLARQSKDWSEVIHLMQEAKKNGYGPLERVEWMPLLEAYVATSQVDQLTPFVSIMGDIPFIRRQTCQLLTKAARENNPPDPEMQASIGETFCK